jgi:hypothetical protein
MALGTTREMQHTLGLPLAGLLVGVRLPWQAGAAARVSGTWACLARSNSNVPDATGGFNVGCRTRYVDAVK